MYLKLELTHGMQLWADKSKVSDTGLQTCQQAKLGMALPRPASKAWGEMHSTGVAEVAVQLNL